MANVIPNSDIASLTIDGVPFEVEGSLSYSHHGWTYETKMNTNGFANVRSQVPVLGGFQGNLRCDPAYAESAFNAITNSTTVLLRKDGRKVIFSGCYLPNPVKVTPSDYVFEVEIKSTSVVDA